MSSGIKQNFPLETTGKEHNGDHDERKGKIKPIDMRKDSKKLTPLNKRKQNREEGNTGYRLNKKNFFILFHNSTQKKQMRR